MRVRVRVQRWGRITGYVLTGVLWCAEEADDTNRAQTSHSRVCDDPPWTEGSGLDGSRVASSIQTETAARVDRWMESL